MQALRQRCPNDNHGRMVVRVRYCPSCGDVLNPSIAARSCPGDAHAKLRRERHAYCMDCGAAVA